MDAVVQYYTDDETQLVDNEMLGVTVGKLIKEVNGVAQTSTQLWANQQLDQTIATECSCVLGGTEVLESFHSGATKEKKFQIATEGLVEKIGEILKRIYDTIMTILRNTLNWINEKLTKKKVASAHEIREQAKQAAEVNEAVKAAPAISKPDVPALIKNSGVDQSFLRGLNSTMGQILNKTKYNDLIKDLANQLRYSEAFDEIVLAFDTLDAWYADNMGKADLNDKYVKEAEMLKDLDKLKAKSIARNSRDDLIATAIKEGNQILQDREVAYSALVTSFTNLIDWSMETPTVKNIENLYDIRAFYGRVPDIMQQVEATDLLEITLKWKAAINEVTERLSRSQANAKTVLSNVSKKDEQLASTQVQRQYMQALISIGNRVLTINKAIDRIENYVDSSSSLVTAMTGYVANAAGVVLKSEYDEDLDHLYDFAAESFKKLTS